MENFKDKVVVVTGGAKGIGKCIVDNFKDAGAKVALFDLLENEYFQGDLAKKEDIESFVKKVIADYGCIDYLIHNALPLMKGIDTCTYEEFDYALKVGISAPFYLTKLLKDYFNENGTIVNISSSRAYMSQAQTESYSSAKGGIRALTHALAISLGPKIRVNSISPGWIHTSDESLSEKDQLQHPVGRVGTPQDIANMVLYLCSEKASFITGEDIIIDGGMTKLMIYHNDYGWSLK